MSSDPRTGFDIHVPSNTMSKALPWLVAFALRHAPPGGTTLSFEADDSRRGTPYRALEGGDLLVLSPEVGSHHSEQASWQQIGFSGPQPFSFSV